MTLKKFDPVDVRWERGIERIAADLRASAVEMEAWKNNPANMCDPYEKEMLDMNINMCRVAASLYQESKEKAHYYLVQECWRIVHEEERIKWARIAAGYADGLV